jgi:hypothetical protein
MTINEKRKYLLIQRDRYLKASRKERSHLLDEMVAVTGLNRKYIILLLQTNLERKPRQKERGGSYDQDVEEALLVVAESLDFICGKRLQPVLLETARNLARHCELELTAKIEKDLARISASTIDRILARHRDKIEKRLPRKSPGRPSRISQQVPMIVIPWDEKEPGHFEVDLVFHSGSHASGDFVYTLQMIDVATGWSGRYAVLGRSGLLMHDAFRNLRHRIPFAFREIHTDNGSEFLNEHMLRFWSQEHPEVSLTRNRPWRKNDSRFVEQRNFTLVRAYLGYDRFDTVAQTRAMNYLYELMDLYYNLFQPIMRVTEKTLIEGEGQRGKVRRHYDKAQTPFQRLCTTSALREDQLEAIARIRDELSPLALRREILSVIEEIEAMPNAVPGEPEHVYLALSNYQPYTVKGGWDVRLELHLTKQLPLTLP